MKRVEPAQRIPTIPPTILLLPLYTAQHSRYTTFASWGIFGMEAFPIVAVSDVNTLVTRDGMRVDDGGWVNGVLPLFLHLGMHHEERIVR